MAIPWLVAIGCGTDPEPVSQDTDGSSSSDDGSSTGEDSAAMSATFQDINGVMWIYSTFNDIRFSDIEDDLDVWKARGIRTLGIYSPYDGEKDQWLGAAPIDFYAVPPQNGTIDDFRSLTASAHDKGMKVVAFMGFHSIDERSEFFRTAEMQYQSGDRTSREVASFHWTDDPTMPTPTPAPGGPSAWKQSEVAGAYYWSLWDNAALDAGTAGGAAEIERAIDFWMEAGLDGFMLDSGVVDPAFRHLWVEVPEQHNSDVWITFESTWSEEEGAFDGFGLTSWFAFEDNDYANTYSLVVFPEQGEAALGVDELEEELEHVDYARDRGKLTHAWSLLEREYPDPRMRAQEAALLAGAGIMYGAPAYLEGYDVWPASVRADWERVLVVVNDNPALHPSASRTRVPAGPNPAYAMVRTSREGDQTALLVYNFAAADVSITVDLRDAGVPLDQSPIDLYGEAAMGSLDAPSYTVDVPGWGFAILDVSG